MPELPEVETVRRSLLPLIENRTIQHIKVYYPSLIRDASHAVFVESLQGRRIKTIERRGKHLLFDMEGVWLLIHLRMEGKFLIKDAQAPKEKHEHARFVLDDGNALCYYDVRKFGTLRVRTAATLYTTDPLLSLGPEPSDDAFTVEQLDHTLGTTRSIKAALLDQRTISGIGNIYADEILYCAKLHPETQAGKVKKPTLQRLVHCSRTIIEAAIESGGTTIRTYKNAFGIDGRFQLSLMVHTREGEACSRCGQTIKKTKVAMRGTYFCPGCQKKRR